MSRLVRKRARSTLPTVASLMKSTSDVTVFLHRISAERRVDVLIDTTRLLHTSGHQVPIFSNAMVTSEKRRNRNTRSSRTLVETDASGPLLAHERGKVEPAVQVARWHKTRIGKHPHERAYLMNREISQQARKQWRSETGLVPRGW